MPRPPRVFVEGGIYDVYNRVTRGEMVFAEDQEAALLLDAMRDARDRDGFTVLAWCIMGNHYHMAVRCGAVPIWRSMASIVTEMAAVLAVRYHSACLWRRRGAARRQDDHAFAKKLDNVDATIASSPPPEGTSA
jgi:REP element-mobilizing transposase RayT